MTKDRFGNAHAPGRPLSPVLRLRDARPPEVVRFAIDTHENFVEMPTPARKQSIMKAPFSNFHREHRTEPVPPGANRLVADIDAAFVQHIFDLPQRKRTYTITARRMISGDVLKQRNGLLVREGYETAIFGSNEPPVTLPVRMALAHFGVPPGKPYT